MTISVVVKSEIIKVVDKIDLLFIQAKPMAPESYKQLAGADTAAYAVFRLSQGLANKSPSSFQRQRHNPHCAGGADLLPPLRRHPQPLWQLSWRATLPQELLSTGKGVPPGRRHLDRKAVVPQVVGDLAVGIGAGIGPKRAAARAIEASSGLEQADHRDLAQVIKGMGGAAGEVSGNFVGQVQVRQRQGVNGGVGVARPLAAGPADGPQAGGGLLTSLMGL
jgi:hypothetical protein